MSGIGHDAGGVGMTEVELNAIVDEIIQSSESSLQAVIVLERRCLEDSALRDALIAVHFHAMCIRLVGTRISVLRRSTIEGANVSGKKADGWVDAVKAGLMNTFPLPSGMLLRDARRPDLRRGAASYRTYMGDMLVKSRFLDLLAEQMPDDQKTVAEVFNDETVADIKRRAAKVPTGAMP